jgi:hypothetical protein
MSSNDPNVNSDDKITRKLEIKKCGACGKPHDFTVEIGHEDKQKKNNTSQQHKIVLTCPETGKPISINISNSRRERRGGGGGGGGGGGLLFERLGIVYSPRSRI